ncbi:MAG: hypothetical protein IPK50_02760 [Fibrobacterota bacterium]|nr:hypothetical protein [Fibrobacterota bacterium]QQS05818.1 MAG: hypothetical protein IPK50_02760 [Fibrobacterota bacterium]
MLQILPALLLLGAADPAWKTRPLSEFVLQDKSTLRAVDSTFLSLSPDRRKRKQPLSDVPASRVGKGSGNLWLVGSAFDSGGLTYLALKQKDGWALRGVYQARPHHILSDKMSFRLAWDTTLPDGRRVQFSTKPYDGKFLPPPEVFKEIGAKSAKACTPQDPVCASLSNSVLLDGTALESRACALEGRFPGINCHVATSAEERRTYVWKPMLYLYPPDTLDVTVTMGRPERVSVSYPALVNDSWTVRAHPGGDLVSKLSGKRYYGLFWEGYSWDAPVSDTGFCLSREEFGERMDSILELKGLNFREREEFITFWIARIAQPFVVVRFPEQAFSQAFPVHILPPPELFLRVFATFEQRATPMILVAPHLEGVRRPAWTAVEWGGQEIHSR